MKRKLKNVNIKNKRTIKSDLRGSVYGNTRIDS